MAFYTITVSFSSSAAALCPTRSAHCNSSSSFNSLKCSVFPSRLSSSRLGTSVSSSSSSSSSFLSGVSFSSSRNSPFSSCKEVEKIWALAASSSTGPGAAAEKEEVFFDGGPHFGDLVTNLVFGLTLVWLPLTLASVFRCLFLRYRFTNLRVTIMSGLTGDDRKDFTYEVIKDVQFVPRFIGEWGDMVITLTDGTKVELKSIPKFREIAKYCLDRAGKKPASSLISSVSAPATGPKGF
jgi:hypothetical protein